MTIRIIPNTGARSRAPKLADAELLFTSGELAGLRLVGLAVYQRPGGARHVTMPCRTYSVNGERRSFALLRPNIDHTPTPTPATARDALRPLTDAILEAYREYERRGTEVLNDPRPAVESFDFAYAL